MRGGEKETLGLPFIKSITSQEVPVVLWTQSPVKGESSYGEFQVRLERRVLGRAIRLSVAVDCSQWAAVNEKGRDFRLPQIRG